MKFVIGSDHAGYEYKTYIIKILENAGHKVDDKGPYSDGSVDYPDYAHPVAIEVETKRSDLGILICGSGNGVCMTANKHQGIRAAICWNTELAKLARQHNNANILCIPARFISKRMAGNIVKAFTDVTFEGGRHQNRVDKISC
ncbi:MAG: ribose 5-phosphate isomerase B [Saprospiraceae bacterium]|nr:ribose 5-phosphate isomerase B [Saprospiraceae bacterium]